MSQNLISATLPEAKAAEINQKLNEVKEALNFLLSIQPSEVSGIIKPGNTYQPFIELAGQTVNNHPEILSGVFNKDEYAKDMALWQALRPIATQINELSDAINKTYYAVGSDVLVASLDVYTSVKQNADKVPGLKSTADEMGVFFKRAKAAKKE